MFDKKVYDKEYARRNPERKSAASRKWISKNQAKVTAYNAEWRRKNRGKVAAYHQTIRCFVYSLKAQLGCERCGEDYWACLDFHHVDGDSSKRTIGNIYSWRMLLKEIEKCELLCANCHRKETWAIV